MIAGEFALVSVGSECSSRFIGKSASERRQDGIDVAQCDPSFSAFAHDYRGCRPPILHIPCRDDGNPERRGPEMAYTQPIPIDVETRRCAKGRDVAANQCGAADAFANVFSKQCIEDADTDVVRRRLAFFGGWSDGSARDVDHYANGPMPQTVLTSNMSVPRLQEVN